MTNKKEKIVCVHCKKIIMEGTEEGIFKEIGEDENIQCPYCYFIYKNPYKK